MNPGECTFGGCVCVCWPGVTRAQGNYEIQVYPSETMTPSTLLVELHSNFTMEGSTTTQFGMLRTQHQQHETTELTQGINEWSETRGPEHQREYRRQTRAQCSGDPTLSVPEQPLQWLCTTSWQP